MQIIWKSGSTAEELIILFILPLWRARFVQYTHQIQFTRCCIDKYSFPLLKLTGYRRSCPKKKVQRETEIALLIDINGQNEKTTVKTSKTNYYFVKKSLLMCVIGVDVFFNKHIGIRNISQTKSIPHFEKHS